MSGDQAHAVYLLSLALPRSLRREDYLHLRWEIRWSIWKAGELQRSRDWLDALFSGTAMAKEVCDA